LSDRAPDLPQRRINVSLSDRSYDVVVGSGVLKGGGAFDALPRGERAVIVTNDIVGPLFGEMAERALRARFSRISTITIPDGEPNKNWQTLNRIFDGLIDAQCDRETTLVALGGGVVGDLTGFAAASYMRGVSYVQVPTTLLAQVDSSVGGKTAINHPAAKNMIGAFHQPSLVVADADTLRTLPERELICGLAEVIKYGAALDTAFLGWIDAHLTELLARDGDALTHAVVRSCEIKAEVVAADERESGHRELLNFGHTFAHAIELGTGYGTWLHGEAVGCGMLMAVEASRLLGLIDAQRADRISELIVRAGLPSRAPHLGIGRYLELMRLDKKARGGEVRLVLLTGPAGATVQRVDDQLVAAVVSKFQA